MKLVLPHCIEEETEAQSNSLIWPKIIQLLTASTQPLSYCTIPLMDAEKLLHIIWTHS